MTDTALLYHPLYDGRGFSPIGDSWRRYRMGLELMRELGLLDRLALICPEPAAEAELELAHTPAFVRYVRERAESGVGHFDRSTPVYPGVYQRARLRRRHAHCSPPGGRRAGPARL